MLCLSAEGRPHPPYRWKQKNHNIHNLALLCFDDHNLATIKGSLSKKLSAQAIIKFRDHHYAVIRRQRNRSLGIATSNIGKITTEDLLTAALNAVMIVELEKIKEEYFQAGPKEKPEIMGRLNKFTNHTNYRLAIEVLDFMLRVAAETRLGISSELSLQVLTMILGYCPYSKNKKESSELFRLCIHIGSNMTHDALIHLKNLAVAMDGLTILKFAFRSAKKAQMETLIKEVYHTYDELKQALTDKSENNNQRNAKELLLIFKNDLKNPSLAYPPLPEHLMSEVERGRTLSINEIAKLGTAYQ